MHKNAKEAGPSGCSQNDAFSLYHKYNLSDCLLPINNMDLIQELKTSMGKDAILEFISAEFSEQAESAYITLENEKLTMENVWVVFHKLLSLVFLQICILELYFMLHFTSVHIQALISVNTDLFTFLYFQSYKFDQLIQV
jgi:hypothetical protein